MENNIDKLLDMYFKYTKEEPVIITNKEHFSNFNDNFKAIDLDRGLNTYKNYWVILRDDMPENNEIIVMGISDYNRNINKLLEEIK